MPALTTKEITVQLKAVPDWSKRAQTIRRAFKFADFLHSLAFVNRIAKRAQKLNHHPDIDIRYDRVTLTLTTYDEGGLTNKVFTLAGACNEIFAKFLMSRSM